jgi:hypothetical protein
VSDHFYIAFVIKFNGVHKKNLLFFFIIAQKGRDVNENEKCKMQNWQRATHPSVAKKDLHLAGRESVRLTITRKSYALPSIDKSAFVC